MQQNNATIPVCLFFRLLDNKNNSIGRFIRNLQKGSRLTTIYEIIELRVR